MRLTDAVFLRLTTDPRTQPLLGDRVYPDILPQPPTFPAGAYTRVSQGRPLAADGATGMVEVHIQLDLYAADRDAVRAVADAACAALHGWQDYTFGVHLAEQVEGSERDLYDDEVQAYRVTADYLVHGTED